MTVVPLNAQAAVHETPLAPDRAASAADQLLREPTNADVREVASAPSSSHLRLSIEPAAFGGGFVYRLTDPLSGKVVRELPRQALIEWRDVLGYVAGSAASIRV